MTNVSDARSSEPLPFREGVGGRFAFDVDADVDLLADFKTALYEYGDPDMEIVADVERYVFGRRAPRSEFVDAVIRNSLYDGLTKAPAKYGTADLIKIIRFVRGAVPAEAWGTAGYHRWLGPSIGGRS